MPYEIQLDHLPAGYALHGCRPGETIDVAFRGFTSFEDGELFISRLEGVPVDIIQKLPDSARADASTTNNLFAILRPDKTASVYYNDFNPPIFMRAKRPIEKGEFVMLDDVLDIDRANLGGFHIPADAGICYVLSFGWRKGYFFDFGPILCGEQRRERDFDLGVVIGQCRAQLMFQHLYSMEESVWETMLAQGWFPFAHLPTERVKTMIRRAQEQFPIDDELDQIEAETVVAVERHSETWAQSELMAPHLQFFRTALDRMKAGDFISAGSILYTRLEGLMRGFHVTLRPEDPTQATLATVASGEGSHALRETSLMLPSRFRHYLTEVYFAHFDPKKPVGSISRNSVSHGVAPAELFDRKTSIIGFLIILQISSVIGATSSKSN